MFGEVYVVPLKATLQQVEEVLGAESVSLPTKSELSALLKHHGKSNTAPMSSQNRARARSENRAEGSTILRGYSFSSRRQVPIPTSEDLPSQIQVGVSSVSMDGPRVHRRSNGLDFPQDRSDSPMIHFDVSLYTNREESTHFSVTRPTPQTNLVPTQFGVRHSSQRRERRGYDSGYSSQRSSNRSSRTFCMSRSQPQHSCFNSLKNTNKG